jgi:hypothetical protein
VQKKLVCGVWECHFSPSVQIAKSDFLSLGEKEFLGSIVLDLAEGKRIRFVGNTPE